MEADRDFGRGSTYASRLGSLVDMSLRVLLLALLLLAPLSVANAQAPAGAPRNQPAGGPRQATAGGTGQGAAANTGKAYAEAVQNAIRLATSRDFDGALAALQEAVQQAPTRPDAYVLMAEVHRMRNDREAARTAYENAARMAAQARANREHGEALMGAAILLEEDAERRTDARKAWTEYVSFADAHRTDTYPETGRARITAIDRMADLERVYVDVRKRIADREKAAAEKPAGRRQGR